MASSFDRISKRENINELFEQLGQILEQRVEVLLIGGAVMLELGLKDSTKDIDIVCKCEEDTEKLLASTKALGFQIIDPQKRHERLGLNRLAVKGARNLDIFTERISHDFCLSETMWQRAINSRSFGKLAIKDASLEDIFIMKLIANRPGDAPDCSNLITAGLDFEAVYQEIETQYRKPGGLEQKVWITYIEEGIGRLEEEFGAIVPIGNRISALANGYRERLYQTLKPGELVDS